MQSRVECLSYKLSMDEVAPIEYVARQIAQIQQRFTQRGGVRPFGISTILSGFSYDGSPKLYSTDPSGTYSEWKAHAIGRNSSSLKEFLEKHYQDGLEEHDAIKLAVRTLLEIVESGGKSMEIVVRRNNQAPHMMTADEIQTHVDEVEREKQAEEEARRAGGSSGAAAGQ